MGAAHGCNFESDSSGREVGGNISSDGAGAYYKGGVEKFQKTDCGDKDCYYSAKNPEYKPERDREQYHATRGEKTESSEKKK